MLSGHTADPVDSPLRDRVSGVRAGANPTIVSISDIHGFLRQARSSLLTLSEHPAYDPVVEAGRMNRLQWVGDEKYVLVFNGDLIDRGPQSERVLEMVERLIDQAPPGHVRVTLGNHEMGALFPDCFDWDDWYSMALTDEKRRSFARAIRAGHVTAGYEGYAVTYAHAGLPEAYDVTAVNDELVAGAKALESAIGTDEDRQSQESLLREYPRVFGVSGHTGRGPDAGIAWLDFEHMPADAPPQVVGHTRTDKPVRKGNVICQNVIRNNRRKDGGEAVFVETPDGVSAIRRRSDGGIEEHEFDLPEKETV